MGKNESYVTLFDKIKTDTPLEYFVDRITEENAYTFCRFGDGEWRCAIDNPGVGVKNCDGHPFYPELGRAIKQIVSRPPAYEIGTTRHSFREHGPKLWDFMLSNGITAISWHDSDVFHKASEKGRLQPLVDALSSRNVVLVGPSHLSALKFGGAVSGRIHVPDKEAWKHRDEIISQIKVNMAENQPAVYSVSAGLAHVYIIDQIYETANEYGHTVIDFGSLWDPYCGVKSRRYMREGKIDEELVK